MVLAAAFVEVTLQVLESFRNTLLHHEKGIPEIILLCLC